MKFRTAGGLLLGALLIVLAPLVAHAHNFAHQVGCGGLSWSATSYYTENNSIVVTVDGTPVHSDPSFGTTDVGSIPWSPTADHTWSIVVDADGTEWDHNLSGIQRACQPTTSVATTIPEETTTSTSTTTTTTQPTSSSTTSTAAPTSTLVADSGTTTAPTTVPAPTDPPTTPTPVIPATGSSSGPVLAVAAVLLMIGTAAVRVARRA